MLNSFNIVIKMEIISYHTTVPPPCHPLSELKEVYFLSSHDTGMPTLNLSNTNEHKIQAYFSLCKQTST